MRTTASKVRETGGFDPTRDLHIHLVAANSLTNYVATKDSAGLLNVDLLLQIETYLACFFAAMHRDDQAFTSKSTGGASGSFQTGMNQPGFLNNNDFGRTAMGLDITGTLTAVNAGNKKVGMHWLGKATQQRQDWNQRNVGY